MLIQSAFVASVQFYVAFLAIGAVGELGPSFSEDFGHSGPSSQIVDG